MLPKTILIGLNKLKPKTLSEGILIREIVDLSVCYQVKKHLLGLGLSHLHISYNYDIYRIDHSRPYDLSQDTLGVDFTELTTINHLLDRNIEYILEEYNLYTKNYLNTVLNFNTTILNQSNIVLSTEILQRS